MTTSELRDPLKEEVWRAVAELEKRFYTRDEIAGALKEVAANVESD